MAALLSAVAGCTSLGESQSGLSCEAREAIGYQQMEAMAESTTLMGVRHSLERVGACEDTGSPRTVLQATVDEWRTRAVANRYFELYGWVSVDGGLISPDGAYRVSNAASKDEEVSSHLFVTVQFVEVADDP